MKFLLLVILHSLSLNAVAQKNLVPFGKIDRADLELKDCLFDKGAEAMVLLDEGKTYYESSGEAAIPFKVIYERRTRIKIFNEKGLRYANITVPFYSHDNTERIVSVKACVYNASGNGQVNTQMVDRKTFYERKVDNFYSEIIAALPGVKVGSVIEYAYKMEIADMAGLKDWFFQGTIPVKISRYQFTIPQIFRYTVNPRVTDKLEQSQKVIFENLIADKKTVSTESLQTVYTMYNLPGIREEPYMSTSKDYMQRAEFQLSQIINGYGNLLNLRLKWSDVINDLMADEDFGQELEKDIPGADSLIMKAKKIIDLVQRAAFIYKNVQQNFTWDKTENIYTSNGIEKAWENKTGNTADINLLLVKLLKDAGVDAAPVLFSTRNNGYVNTLFPHLNQFNVVMAYVNIPEGDLILDATTKYNDYRLIPAAVANLRGFIVNGERGEWKTFFCGNHHYKNIITIHGNVTEDGHINGEITASSFDYAKTERLQSGAGTNEDFKTTFFPLANTGFKLGSISFNNTDADSLPLEQKLNFTGTAKSSSGYKFFPANLFTGFANNPFIASERISDIEFGCPQFYTFFSSFTIPDNYSFFEVPHSILLAMPDTSIIFSRSVQVDANMLSFKTTLQFKKSIYPAADYLEFAAFYKKMFARLNDQVVLKKNEP